MEKLRVVGGQDLQGRVPPHDLDAEAAVLSAVMLDRLGPVAWHESPTAAMAVLEELEETARLVMMCRSGTTPLTESQIQELRDAQTRTGCA